MFNIRLGQASGALAAVLGETHHSLGGKDRGISYSVFKPHGDSKAVVVLVPDLFGRSIFYQLLATRVAADGYTVVLPELFSNLRPVAEGDFERAMGRLAELDQEKSLSELEELFDEVAATYAGADIFAMGFSVGGTLSMMLATRRDLAGAVIFYGFPARRPATKNAPYIFVEHATSIKCPIIGFWGETEERVPSRSLEELAAVSPSMPHIFEIVSVPDAGHSFLCFDENDPRFAASSSAWQKAIQFIKSNTQSEG